MTVSRDPRVDEYIAALPAWQRAVCERLRELVPDPDGIITGGHGNTTARTVAFHEHDPIPEAALVTMLRQIVANNRAGGWRALKRR